MLLSVPLVLGLSACSKPEQAPASEQIAPEDTATSVSPEQQAAIDAIDKQNLDEKNTDVVESAASEVAASEVQ